MLRLAPEVEALEPAALRDAVIERLKSAGRVYGVA
jgi:hypothetical protein